MLDWFNFNYILLFDYTTIFPFFSLKEILISLKEIGFFCCVVKDNVAWIILVPASWKTCAGVEEIYLEVELWVEGVHIFSVTS